MIESLLSGLLMVKVLTFEKYNYGQLLVHNNRRDIMVVLQMNAILRESASGDTRFGVRLNHLDLNRSFSIQSLQCIKSLLVASTT